MCILYCKFIPQRRKEDDALLTKNIKTCKVFLITGLFENIKAVHYNRQYRTVFKGKF